MEFTLINRFSFAGGGWLSVRITSARIGESTEFIYRMNCSNDEVFVSAKFFTVAECLNSLASWVSKGESGEFK